MANDEFDEFDQMARQRDCRRFDRCLALKKTGLVNAVPRNISRRGLVREQASSGSAKACQIGAHAEFDTPPAHSNKLSCCADCTSRPRKSAWSSVRVGR